MIRSLSVNDIVRFQFRGFLGTVTDNVVCQIVAKNNLNLVQIKFPNGKKVLISSNCIYNIEYLDIDHVQFSLLESIDLHGVTMPGWVL